MLTSKREVVLPETAFDVTFGYLSGTLQPSRVVSIPTYSAMDKFEEITPNSEGSRSDWKEFEHYKLSHTPNDLTFRHHLDYGGYDTTVWQGVLPAGSYHTYHGRGFGDPGMPLNGLPGLYSKRADGGFVPPPADLSSVLARATRSLLPEMKSELSLINSVIELKDFASVPNTLRQIYNLPDSIRKGYLTLRNVLRAGSNAYLQKKFAWDPLISDISSIYTALARYERRLNDLVSRAGGRRVKHFTVSLQEFKDYAEETITDLQCVPAIGSDSFGTIYNKDYYHLYRRVICEPSRCHVEIQYNYNYTEYQRAHARVLGLLDALGVNLNPAIIWNAIPWSFVIDWVIGVGRWLDQFKVTNMTPQINIQRCLWSILRKRRIILGRYRPGPPYFSSRGPDAPFPMTHESAYRRGLWQPESSWITASGLSLNEITLGAALVLVRGRNHRRNMSSRRISYRTIRANLAKSMA